MKKTFSLILLTLLTLGLFRPITALAEEQKLPSGIDRNQVGQKIQDYVKEHEKTTAAMETAVFDKDSTIYQGNFGYMDKEKGIKVIVNPDADKSLREPNAFQSIAASLFNDLNDMRRVLNKRSQKLPLLGKVIQRKLTR